MRDLPAAPPPQCVERFWAKVVRSPHPDGCWIFTGAISSPDGYGRVVFREGGRQYAVSAHRFALWLTGVDIRDPEVVADHRCNEALCVRCGPGHLIASTREANMAFASISGTARGRRPGWGLENRTRLDRSRAVRAAVADGWDEEAYRLARSEPLIRGEQMQLFDIRREAGGVQRCGGAAGAVRVPADRGHSDDFTWQGRGASRGRGSL